MAWISQNKAYLSGTISSALVLNSANSESGVMPSGTVTYNDGTYNDYNYQLTAFYEGMYQFAYQNNSIDIVGAGGVGDIKYQIAYANTTTSFTGFSAIFSAIGTKNINIPYYYFKMRFYYYSSLWSDADYIQLIANENIFNIFSPGQVIDADAVNYNFYQIRQESLFPRAGNYLLQTTGVYNVGEDIYRWNTAYGISANLSGSITIANNSTIYELSVTGSLVYDKLYAVVNYIDITSQTYRVQISGLNSDSDNIYMVRIYQNANTTTAFHQQYINMTMNGDSSSSYYYHYIDGHETSTVCAGCGSTLQPMLRINADVTEAPSPGKIFVDLDIFCPNGQYKMVLSEYANMFLESQPHIGATGDIYLSMANIVSFEFISAEMAFKAGSSFILWSII